MTAFATSFESTRELVQESLYHFALLTIVSFYSLLAFWLIRQAIFTKLKTWIIISILSLLNLMIAFISITLELVENTTSFYIPTIASYDVSSTCFDVFLIVHLIFIASFFLLIRQNYNAND